MLVEFIVLAMLVDIIEQEMYSFSFSLARFSDSLKVLKLTYVLQYERFLTHIGTTGHLISHMAI